MHKMKLCHFFVFFLAIFILSSTYLNSVTGQTNEELFKRIEEFEFRLSELEDKSVSTNDRLLEVEKESDETKVKLFEFEDKLSIGNLVTAFDAEHLNIGGFFTTNFISLYNDDENESAFEHHHLELVIAPRITENIKAFFTFETMIDADWDDSFVKAHSPAGVAHPPQALTSKRKFGELSFENHLLIGWGEYELADWLNIKFGRYITPWGIRNTEHFQPLFFIYSSPMFLREFEEPASHLETSPMIASALHGFEVNGRLNFGRNFLKYSTYVGNSMGPDLDLNRATNIVAGLRLAYSMLNDNLVMGVNYQHGRRGHAAFVEADELGETVQREEDYDAWGFDIKAKYGNFGLDAEFIKSAVKNSPNQIGGYIRPYYKLSEKWVTFYRFDYVDLRRDISGNPDLTERQEHIVGLNYLPHHILRIRGEFIWGNSNANKDPSFFPNPHDPDFKAIDISATISF